MLQVPRHTENDGAEDVGGECTHWERRDEGVHVFRGVEAEKTPQGSEDEGEGGAEAPVRGVVAGGEDGDDDGAEPAEEGEDDGEGVEEFAGEAEGDGRCEWLEE